MELEPGTLISAFHPVSIQPRKLQRAQTLFQHIWQINQIFCKVGRRSFELHGLLGVGSFGSASPTCFKRFQEISGVPRAVKWMIQYIIVYTYIIYIYRIDIRKSSGRSGAQVATILGQQLPSRRLNWLPTSGDQSDQKGKHKLMTFHDIHIRTCRSRNAQFLNNSDSRRF